MRPRRMESLALPIEATSLSAFVPSPNQRRVAVGRLTLLGQFCHITRLGQLRHTGAHTTSPHIRVASCVHLCRPTGLRFVCRLPVKSLGRVGEFPMECVSLVSQPQFAESRRVCIRGKAWALGSEFGDTQMILPPNHALQRIPMLPSFAGWLRRTGVAAV